jgi:Ni,Fe-hydrogenase maturation factor
MEVYVIGVQPADLRVSENMTPAIKIAADEIVSQINETISECHSLKEQSNP